MVTITQGEKYARALKALSSPEKLLRTFVFGSLSRHGYGEDLDIIIEVSEETFLTFASNCIGALDGYHPITCVLMPMYSHYWDYYSAKSDRLDKALTAIGISNETDRLKLSSLVPDNSIDILCLPTGWENPEYADGLLQKTFGLSRDPNFLQKVQKSRVEVT